MLAIRLQRTGRSGHAQFRIIVQDSRFSPTRGRVVAYLGSYNPHTKTATVDSEQAAKYMENGAQPSDRVARLLQKEGIKLPDWVKLAEPKQRTVRNPEKRRSTAPADTSPEASVPEEPVTEQAPAESSESSAEAEQTEAAEETPVQPSEAPAEDPAESESEEKPAE